MNLTPEGIIVTLAIAAAAAYLILRALKRLRGKSGGCGKSGNPAKKKVQLTIGGQRVR